MPNSLRCEIKKLVVQRKLSEQEGQYLLKKLDGHDKCVREDFVSEFWNVVRGAKVLTVEQISLVFEKLVACYRTEGV